MASVTLQDLSLRDCRKTDRVEALRKAYFRAVPEICTERPCLLTKFHLDHGLFEKETITILDKARAYRFVLENRKAVVVPNLAYDRDMQPFRFDTLSLFAGSTTSKYKGVPVFPEFLGLSLWPELGTIPRRPDNPFYLSSEAADDLNRRVFPFWIKANIHERTRSRFYPRQEGWDDPDRPLTSIELMEKLVFFLASKPKCISHTVPDFSKAISNGLRAQIHVAADRGRNADSASKRLFYSAVCEVLEGIIAYSRRLADSAEALAQREGDAARRHELRELAAIHRRVPEGPAESFRDALTTLWMCWIAVHLENPDVGLSLGRLDQLLYPYYVKDMERGSLNLQNAVELLCCLWLKIGDHVPSVPEASEQLFGGTGSNQAVTVGGVDAAGKNAVNDLTYLILRATELMRLRDPNLNARYCPGVSPDTYLRCLCEVNVSTGATPALHNDRAVIKALTACGDTLEQARDYAVVGCVEPGSQGRYYGHSASLLLNLTSVLELTLFAGKHRHTGERTINRETDPPDRLDTFEAFLRAFETQARWLIARATELNNQYGKIHQEIYPTPILSALFEGPMENGKDLIEGGARINASGATIIGLADVADSLTAIQTLVYKEKTVTFSEFLDALRKDFQGHEALYARLNNSDRTPKYGNDNPVADANAQWLVKLLHGIFDATPNYRGGRYRVGYWTMTNHAGLGRIMGATPNGRMAGKNFSSGITPVSRMAPDLGNALLSAASLPTQCLTSGVALNLKYTPEIENPEDLLDRFMTYTKAYFSDSDPKPDGGMEIQFNVIRPETLLKAYEHPELPEYAELLVRVSGYTAYFKDLNRQMQREIIERTMYRLSTGAMLDSQRVSLRPPQS
jgi:pyruvate formate-lyase/glycerol dehydratase family glycyl radical enzyme